MTESAASRATTQTRYAPSYLACRISSIPVASDEPFSDGNALARNCIAQLGCLDLPDQFPPQLLLLLASPEYADETKARGLVKGVRGTFREALERGELPKGRNLADNGVPLIGCTTAGLIHGGCVHESGALLVCFASRSFSTKVAFAPQACDHPDRALDTIADALDLTGRTPKGAEREIPEDINPMGDLGLLVFLPGVSGCRHPNDPPSAYLFELLNDATLGRMAMAGGVASANSRTKAGVLFANDQVGSGAMVVARLATGHPFGMAIMDGIRDTSNTLTVNRLAKDRLAIVGFKEHPKESAGAVLNRLQENVGFFVFRDTGTEDGLFVVPDSVGPNGEVPVHPQVSEGAVLRLAIPDREDLLKSTEGMTITACGRVHMDNPVIDLLFACAGLYHRRNLFGFDSVSDAISTIEEFLPPEVPVVGALFDGEIGQDRHGNCRFRNFTLAGMLLGDELRQRGVVDRGFQALAGYAPILAGMPPPDHSPPTAVCGLDDVIRAALEMIVEIGYPGAMLSLVLRDRGMGWVIAQKPEGARFGRVWESTRRPFRIEKPDILASIAKSPERRFEYVAISAHNPECDPEAVADSGIISQAIIRVPGTTPTDCCAVVQIDLGDVSYHRGRLHPAEERVLKAIGDSIAAGLNRHFSREELRIARELDAAITIALAQETVSEGVRHYILRAIDILGVKEGHVRLYDPQKKALEIVAGHGDYYDIACNRKRDVNETTGPGTWATFHDDTPFIANSPCSKTGYNSSQSKPAADRLTTRALDMAKSFARVACVGQNEERVGTIHFSTDVEWFFNQSHVNSLRDAGRRLALLVQSLRRKEAEQSQRNRLDFLLKVGPRLPLIGEDRPVQELLSNMMKRLCEAIRAHVGSLYLWEEELKLFVLRAQFGWKEEQWVGAARYAENEGWTGTSAKPQQCPQWIANLAEHKRGMCQDYTAKYAVPMFGDGKPQETSKEAIALPLRVGNRLLGIATMHRSPAVDLAAKSGFTTRDTEILREAADDVASLVSNLMRREEDEWQRREHLRRNKVLSDLIKSGGGAPDAIRVCKAVRQRFSAKRVSLYGFLRNGNLLLEAEAPQQAVRRLDAAEEEFLQSAKMENGVRTKHQDDNKVRSQVDEYLKGISSEGLSDITLSKLRTIGFVNRAAIPLIFEADVTGVLDIQWEFSTTSQFPVSISHHSSRDLQRLGDHIAVYLQKQRLAQREEDSRRSVMAMGAMVTQLSHRFGNLAQSIRTRSRKLVETLDESERIKWQEQLEETIGTVESLLSERLAKARYASATRASYMSLQDVVRKAADNIAWSINPIITVSEKFSAYIDEEQIIESLTNLLDNAQRAVLDMAAEMTQQKRQYTPRVSVHATFCDAKKVMIQIADNGVGMEREELEQARGGWFTTRGGKGVGVLIASLMAELNRGELEIQSARGFGTTAKLYLPTMEDHS